VALLALALTTLAAPAPVPVPVPVPANQAELRERIEALSGHDRAQAIELARQALGGPLSPEQRAWFLDRMTADELYLRRWKDALATAELGVAQAGADTVQRVRFQTQAGYAYLGLGQPLAALGVSEALAPLLTPLLKSVDTPGYRQALDAQRLRGAALLSVPRKAEAMTQLTQVLRRYDELDDSEGRAETLHMIASLRSTSGDRFEAVRAEQAAIDAATQAHLKGILPRLHSLMAFLQSRAGDEAAFLHELQAARASAIDEGDEYTQAKVAFNLTSVAIADRDWTQALRLIDQAYPIFVKLGDLNMADLCLIDRGISLSRTGHHDAGIALIRQAAATLATRPGQEITLVDVQKTLAEEYALAGNFEQAYAARLEYERLDRAVHEADNQKRIAEAEAAYQADRQQRQIEALKHERQEQTRFRWLWVLVGTLGVAIAVVAAVSRHYLNKAYRAMHDMALEDPLTGLHNRRYLDSRIGEELAQLRRLRPHSRPTETSAAFVLIDLDHFKSINDEHGHAAGDAVLRQASTLLRSLVRQSDTIVRWGGEEFLVFAKVSGCEEAGELAERICTRMAAHEFEIGAGRRVRRTCSVGFACYPSVPEGADATGLPSWEGVVSLADQCLYAAKASGRDLWAGLRCAAGRWPLTHLPEVHEGIPSGDFVLHHRAGREVRWPQRR